jgi:hypothetical protein
VNDVEVNGATVVHPGDLLAEGELQYLVLPAPRIQQRAGVEVLDYWRWQLRLTEEIDGGESSFAVLLGRSGAFSQDSLGEMLARFGVRGTVRCVLGRWGTNLLGAIVPGSPTEMEIVRQTLAERAATMEETVRWGSALYPKHGATGEELWEHAVERLLGIETRRPEDFAWSDPSMTRLRGFAERWAGISSLVFLGGEGVGRESLARYVRSCGDSAAPFIVHRAARWDRPSWDEDVARASGGSLHLRRPETLPEAELRAFWGARVFRPSAALRPDQGSTAPPENRIVVPDLAHRPADVTPIAESVLHSVDVQLGRRRSSLRAETRTLLATIPYSENVRTLRNTVIRGALNATSAELRPEHLELASPRPASRGVRDVVREAERLEIESALRGSGWNVTEAARKMALPRRTLVYRMTRLGLRRPTSHD